MLITMINVHTYTIYVYILCLKKKLSHTKLYISFIFRKRMIVNSKCDDKPRGEIYTTNAVNVYIN